MQNNNEDRIIKHYCEGRGRYLQFNLQPMLVLMEERGMQIDEFADYLDKSIEHICLNLLNDEVMQDSKDMFFYLFMLRNMFYEMQLE